MGSVPSHPQPRLGDHWISVYMDFLRKAWGGKTVVYRPDALCKKCCNLALAPLVHPYLQRHSNAHSEVLSNPVPRSVQRRSIRWVSLEYAVGLVYQSSGYCRHLVVCVVQKTKPITHRGRALEHPPQLSHEARFVDRYVLGEHRVQ